MRTFFCAMVLAFAATARGDDFILSYWCGPPETVKDLKKAYREVADCGFNYAMLPCSGASIKGNLAILDACKKYKLKYIVIDSRLLGDPASPAFKTNVTAVVTDYGRHPALGGYFIGDEPDHLGIARIAYIHQTVAAADPNHAPFANLFPNYAPEWAYGGTYEQYVEKYLTTVKPRLLSFDHYALLNDGTLRPIFFENLEVIRRQGLKHHVPFGFIFQLTPHGGYRDPSEDELRWQVNSALVYGAKALMYFTYWHPPADPIFAKSVAIVDNEGKRTHHYEQAKRVNAAINAWAPTLMKLKSTGVYHTGPLPQGSIGLPENFLLKIKNESALVVGMFQHEDGSEWVMIVNRDLHKPAEATLQFTEKIKGLRELSSTKGKLSSVRLHDDELSFSLPVGGAKLFRISR